MDAEKRAGERRAEQSGCWNRRVHAGDRAAALLLAKPVAQIDDHAGEEARLGGAEKEACSVKLGDVVNESGEEGDQAPGDHDARDPFAGGPALNNDGAGNLEEDVGY